MSITCRGWVRVRIVAFGAADPPRMQAYGIARATVETVGIAPGLGIDPRADPGTGPGTNPR